MSDNPLELIESALPFWSALTIEERDLLRDHISLRHIPAGAVMNGGVGDCAGLFLIRKGQARAFILSETGKEITLYRLFEKDFCIFSASCMMKDISFDVLVEAEKETEAYLIPTPVYQSLMKQSRAILEFTNQLMSSRFSDVMWIMEQILFMSVDRRLALFLLEQAAIEGTDRISITHETIAKNLGTAREVVTRMLKYFAAEGLVELFRGGIILKDRKKLIEHSKN